MILFHFLDQSLCRQFLDLTTLSNASGGSSRFLAFQVPNYFPKPLSSKVDQPELYHVPKGISPLIVTNEDVARLHQWIHRTPSTVPVLWCVPGFPAT